MGSYDGVHPAEKQLPPALRTAQRFQRCKTSLIICIRRKMPSCIRARRWQKI